MKNEQVNNTWVGGMWVGEGIITSVSYILYIFTVQVEISDRFMAMEIRPRRRQHKTDL